MSRKVLRVLVVVAIAGAGAAAYFLDVPARLGWTASPASEPLTLYGNVDIRQVRLGFRVGGRLAEALVDEGDHIVAGNVLARLDMKPLEDSVRAYEAQVEAMRATLEKLEAGPRAAEIAQARATHAERLADLKNTEQMLARVAALAPTGAVSRSSLVEAQANRDMAAARAASAREALRLLEDGERAEDIAAARANLHTAEANLSTARTSLADAELRAPSDGVVLSRAQESGAILSQGDTVYVLSLVQPVWVRAYIAEPDLGRIYPGMAVEVMTDTAPDRPYRGVIGFISPVAEFTPKSVETPELRTDLVYRLRITVTEADEGLRQGMPVTVRIPLSGSST
ncbi:secretion protein HlyD [Haematobacter missouriensis]|uniref:Secretion protein HlyD n=1 Tax=Haematobacter missouriensis TaxID=366616 RepID=A0ABX3ZNA8_9RHOB|nr:secretion protein HlyD [Haematobacter missouriensis]KFI25258.1 secretion protein HlyD [Haematobacter missouriensis]OWJ70857.1 secretion protein HlyD [Haematobacter missouriensis]